MSKHKKKTTTRNPLRYWLDELIFFRRDFLIESTASAEDCAEAIIGIQSYEERSFGRRRPPIIKTTVTPTNVSNKTYTFEVHREQAEKRNYYQTSSINGTITTDDDGVTFIEGASKMTGRYYWFVIIAFGSVVLYNLTATPRGSRDWPLIAFGLAMLSYLWWTMYRDRNVLVNELTAVIDAAENTKRKSQLQSDNTSTDSIYKTCDDTEHNQRGVNHEQTQEEKQTS